MAADHWIKGAIERPGSLRATAKRDGLIKGDQDLSFADLKKLSRSDNRTTQRRAELAETLKKMHK
jgi:hypothetical protein